VGSSPTRATIKKVLQPKFFLLQSLNFDYGLHFKDFLESIYILDFILYLIPILLTLNFRSCTAIVTPFNPATLEIDESKFRELINWQIESGVDGLVVAGTTGESATLSHEEHRQVIDIAIDEAKKRVKIIAGAGSNNTSEAVSLAEHAKKSNADAILSVGPYYNKPTQDGFIAHYSKIAEVGVPLILYNVPGRTGRNIEATTTLELAKNPNIIGIKEASNDLAQIKEICEKKPADFAVISGEDSQTLDIIRLGGVGAIGVVLNEAPKEISEMIHVALNNEWEKAEKINTKFTELIRLNFVDNNPIDVKWALHEMGKISYATRLPLTEPSEENKILIKNEVKKIINNE
jgi:4-hydroxy-tetrahydrodipicolinate synthase